jgi:hypothetical protein
MIFLNPVRIQRALGRSRSIVQLFAVPLDILFELACSVKLLKGAGVDELNGSSGQSRLSEQAGAGQSMEEGGKQLDGHDGDSFPYYRPLWGFAT